MWSYNKVNNGFQLKYDVDDNPDGYPITGFNVFFPYKYEGRDYIVYWNEKRMKELVDGLNDGSIPIDITPSIDDEEEEQGLKFLLTIPESNKTAIQFKEKK